MFERPLKINRTDDVKVFFTSDTHFSHAKNFIFESRGYKNREEHDGALICKINERVRYNDILFHLGDFCLNITPPEFNSILYQINCQTIYYIWGNHNSCIRGYYEDAVSEYLKLIGYEYDLNERMEVYPYKIGKLIYLGYYKEIIVNGQSIVLHHYPHDIFNGQQKNAWQLSGHSHYSNPKTRIDFADKKILDVGWDGHHRPLEFSEIVEIMRKKKNVSSDHHETAS